MSQDLVDQQIQNGKVLEQVQEIMDEAPDLYEALAKDKFD